MAPTDTEKDLLNGIGDDLLYALLDNPYESLILVDKEGIIRFMSSANEGLYPVTIKEAVGRHIREVNPDSQIHHTLETGKAEIGEGMMLGDKQRIVARFPIYQEKNLIGAAGKLMFLHPKQLKALYDKISLLEHHLDYYKRELTQSRGSRYSFDTIIGNSIQMQQARELAGKAAGSNSPVIIVGETGTGKELFAHAIHDASKRRNHALVRVNCASIPRDLFESELFGYKPGAFSGAEKKGKIGKFELAHNGTIFLDEIGDMPISMQIKLMRVLQEKEIEPIGATQPKPIDFRLISATNRNLEDLISNGEFRLDLYYRINLMAIQLPPLREVKNDIPLMVNHFLKELGSRKKAFHMSEEAITAMTSYAWPGNIRELKNVVERAVMVCDGTEITEQDLPIVVQKSVNSEENATGERSGQSLQTILENAEKQAIVNALKQSCNNKSEASKLLGIHRTGLYQKMKKYKVVS